MITTLAALTRSISARFTFLVEIYPSQWIQNWTEYSDTVFYNAIGAGVDVQSVVVDDTTYTEADDLTDVVATASQWFYDGATLYVHVAGSAGTTLNAKTVVANYKVYYSNDAKVFNDHYYHPMLESVPNIRQSKNDTFWGVSIISSGKIVLANGDSEFDTIYNSWAWENKQLNILFGGEDLAYTEYVSVFDGIITEKVLSLDSMEISFSDKKEELTSSLEYETYAVADFTDLNAEDVGKPIPYVWGSVKKMPVICINRDESPVPTNYEFKVATTTNHDIGNVTAAYVNDIEKTIVSVDTTEGTFTIAATDYTSGDTVIADVTGYQDVDGNTIENPIDVLQEVMELAGFTDADWDTDARTVAQTEAADFPIGLVMDAYGSMINAIGEIMKSCFGTFFINNDGEYSVNVFTPIAETGLDIISDLDIKDGTFRAKAEASKIRKVFRCGYLKNWGADKYVYSQSTATNTERIYGITKSRTVPTLLSSSAGAAIWLGRMKMLYEDGVTEITYATSLQFASKNIGDQMMLSFRRRREDSDIPWLSDRRIEILDIAKNFQSKEMSFIVDDLKGLGANVGHWTDVTSSFPDLLGGGAMTEWDADWEDSQKEYAFQNWGFWTDAEGLIDADDSLTLNKSRWW